MGEVKHSSACIVITPVVCKMECVDVAKLDEGRYYVCVWVAGQAVSLHLTRALALELMQALDKQLLADDQEADGTAEKAQAEILDNLSAAGG